MRQGKNMILAAAALVVGIVVGKQTGMTFPAGYSVYTAMVILVTAAVILEAFAELPQKEFKPLLFVKNLVFQAVFAVILVWAGNVLGINMTTAVIVLYGWKLFTAFGRLHTENLYKRRTERMTEKD